jgi:hypothetical protein
MSFNWRDCANRRISDFLRWQALDEKCELMRWVRQFVTDRALKKLTTLRDPATMWIKCG